MGLMKTLTITEAKKNLGKWLKLAGKGEDVGIINGAQIFALHLIEVQPVDRTPHIPIDSEYLQREYGMTKEEMERVGPVLDARYEESLRSRNPVTVENPTIKKLKKAVRAHARPSRPAQRAEGKRAR